MPVLQRAIPGSHNVANLYSTLVKRLTGQNEFVGVVYLLAGEQGNRAFTKFDAVFQAGM
jgi:hypothetical protein